MGTLPASDAELATLACAGEVEALAALLERYRPSLYAAAIRLLRNRDDALDAVQETCVVALVRLGALRDPEAVGGWLHAVLRNTCLMRLRSSHRDRAPEQAVVPALAPSGCSARLSCSSAPLRHAETRWTGLPWMRMPSQSRPGSRVVTSWTSQVLPSGSVKEQNDA